MPMHDWTRVEAGIYHAVHHWWVSAISDVLNGGLLPRDHYALPERFAGNFGPDVLALHEKGRTSAAGGPAGAGGGTTLCTRPHTRFTAETEGDFYRRKQKALVVRHVSGDEIVAVIEIVSPGNKSSRKAFRDFLDKAYELLEQRIHLLIVDPLPPGPRDPEGVHGALWEDLQGDSFHLPEDRRLTLAAYECAGTTRATIEPIAVGDALPDMPLFLKPNGCVMVPLEATYTTAFDCLPGRWREVLLP